MKTKFDNPWIYLPISFWVIASVVILAFEMKHFSSMIGTSYLIWISLGIACVLGILIYSSQISKMDGESVYIATGSVILFSFVVFFATISYLSRYFSKFDCQSGKYEILSYEGRYGSAYGLPKDGKIKANQWSIVISKDGKQRRFVLDKDIISSIDVTKHVQLQFCKGWFGTEYLKFVDF